MKKSSLTTAVLAGIAGLVGFAGSSQAVELNPDGTGEVLIYPYYTVNAGQQSLFSVVNTSEVGKAVKVRFLEGYNSREVLDFNLFLSPYDVWTATVFALDDAGEASVGAAVGTRDMSCTVPYFQNLSTEINGLHYQPFSTLAFTGDDSDGGPTDVSRTREGYLEMIQMADVNGASLAAITHTAGVPDDCAATSLRELGNTDFTTPTGGLFGSGTIVDVADGTLFAYNADAIAGFYNVADNNLFSESGSLLPNLTDAETTGGVATAYVFNGDGTLVTATYPSGTADAVSAVFMASGLMNEWVSDAEAGQGTDWVVTFPTKRFYVNGAAPLPPFENVFAAPGVACDVVDVAADDNSDGLVDEDGAGIFDREEGFETVVVDDPFSPAPDGADPSSLCYEVNIITMGGESVLGSEALVSNLTVFGNAGWMKLGLNEGTVTDMTASGEGVVFSGMPATGFQATRFINGNLGGGVLSNYAGAYHHRVERAVSTAAAPIP